MKKLNAARAFSGLLVIALILIGQTCAYAFSSLTPNPDGSVNVDSDQTVTENLNITYNVPLPNTDTTPYAALNVASQKKLDSENLVEIKINVTGNRNSVGSYSNVVYGIYTNEGIVDFSQSKVIVNGLHYGVYTLDGIIKLGNGSEITADLKGTGEAIKSAGDKGLIEVGNSAKITGTNANDAGAVVSATHKGTINIGSGAIITNDATNSPGGAPHSTIEAFAGGIVNIGSGSLITNKFDMIYSTSYLVKAGGTDVGDPIPTSIVIIGSESQLISTSPITSFGISLIDGGNVTLEKDSLIQMNGNNQYGIYLSGDKDKKVVLKDNVDIVMKGNKSMGMRIGNKGEVILGEGNEIIIEGTSSYGAHVIKKGSLVIGAGSSITTEKKDSYGIYLNEEATVELGKGSTIEIKGDSSYGLYLYEGGTASFKENTKMKISGDSSVGIYYHSLLTTGGKFTLGEGSSIEVTGKNSSAFFFYNENFTASPTAGHLNLTFDKISASSEQSNLITAAAGLIMNVSFSNSTLKGDILATEYEINVNSGLAIYLDKTETINLELTGKSSWEGSKATSSYFGAGHDMTASNYIVTFQDVINTVNLSLKGNSKWVIGKNSFLDSLEMETVATSIEFLHDFTDENNPYYRAELESIKGLGTFIMNVDMKLGKGDFIYAKKAEGSYFLQIKSNVEGGVESYQILEFDEYLSGTEDSVRLTDGTNLIDKVQIGAYGYKLESANDFLEWWLIKLALDNKVREDAGASVVGMNEFVKLIDMTLSDETLKTKNNVWGTFFYALQNFDEKLFNKNLNQHVGGGFVGIDNNVTDQLSLGAFFGLNLARQNIGADSLGNISSLTVGTYANYSNHGFTTSAYLRIANYQNDLTISGTSGNIVTAGLGTYGFGGSLQLSYEVPLAGGVYLEPKGKAIYTYIKGQTYDVGGMKLETPTASGIVTWLGAKVGVKSEHEKASYDFYLESGWMYDTNPEVTYFTTENNDKSVVSLGKNRWELGVGFSADLMEQSNILLEFKYSRGEGITQPIKVVLGGSCFF